MNWNSGSVKTCRLPFGQHLGDAASRNEQHQRRNDGLDAKTGDQPAVEPAERARDQHRDDERQSDADQRGRQGTILPRKINGARAPEIAISEPTDRSIPCCDHEGHAHSDDHDRATWVRLTFRVCQVAKFGVKARLKTSRSASATTNRSGSERSSNPSAAANGRPRRGPPTSQGSSPIDRSHAGAKAVVPCAMAARWAVVGDGLSPPVRRRCGPRAARRRGLPPSMTSSSSDEIISTPSPWPAKLAHQI